MSGNTPAVAGILPELRAVLLGLPAEHRQSVAAFWVKVRQEIRALENAGPSSSSPIVAPSRPTSSASVARERRQLIDNTIADAIPEEEPSNAALTVLSLLPSGWIRSRVQSYPKRSNSLGCWLHTSQPAHKEYVKDNMRNTAHPDTKRPLGIQLYVHQVALAGKDGGSAEILLCGRGGSHEVSHLCHNGGCFNPSHLVVEEKSLNAARNSYQGRFIFVAPNGTAFHPCPHTSWRGVHNRRPYLLPKKAAKAEWKGKWLEVYDGELVERTGGRH